MEFANFELYLQWADLFLLVSPFFYLGYMTFKSYPRAINKQEKCTKNHSCKNVFNCLFQLLLPLSIFTTIVL